VPTEDAKKTLVAYVPFKTFLSAIETLAQHGIPTQVDRSVWPSYSGATLSQLLIAFRFFGLTTSDGKATPELEKLVSDKDNRKANLRKLLERSYPQLCKDVTKMTTKSFSTAMANEFKAEGETQKKIQSFFLQAARYAGLPLSSFLMNKTRQVSNRKRRPNTAQQKGQDRSAVQGGNGMSQGGGPTKTFRMQKGVTLTLSASADVFAMEADDREFVNKILKELEEYQFNVGNGE
jgi:hypothetical protein